MVRIAGQNVRVEQKISQIEEKKAKGKIDGKILIIVHGPGSAHSNLLKKNL